MPKAEPSTVPRKIAGAESCRSFRVGIRPVIFAVIGTQLCSDPTWRMTSANANRPTAAATKLTPSASVPWPKSKRITPELTSVQTVANSTPTVAIAVVVISESDERAEAVTSAMTISDA